MVVRTEIGRDSERQKSTKLQRTGNSGVMMAHVLNDTVHRS